MEFEEIYRNYFKDVYYYVLGLSADTHISEEITQDTFFKAYRSIKKYDGKSSITAWLFTIARNTYFTFCRKKKISYDEAILDMQPDNRTDILTEMVENETAAQIWKEFQKLEEPYKEVFNLRVFGELSFESIGKAYNKSAGWARVTYYRARVMIKNRVEEM